MKKLIMTMVLMPMMALAASNLYMVIDLSDGPSATSYLVSYLDSIPTGGWTDEYKTSKLVLRRIESGSFKMCGEYDVTLTKSFYCGVFEVTQKQYELVTGMNPSEHKGDMRPVEMVSYDAIRGSLEGAKWPESSAVDSNSFMGKLRARTGLDFDLPTEAQWEYACRAGTTNLYNNGGSMEYDLRQLGRYVNNQSDGKGGYSEHTTVGSYLPNAWGLYDMHGNALERCLDWYGTLTNGVDPQGPSSGSERVRRGGAFCWYADWCTSVYRSTGWFGACIAPSDAHDGDGFRLSLTISTPQALLDLPTTWYVNGSTGSDSNSGTSESAPKATIQAAIDASAAGDTILVAPGTYAPIMTENKAITIQSTADAKTTIIDASGTSRRCVTGRMETGYDAHRDICTNTVVIGFTLQNGEANLPLHYSGEYNGGCADGGIYKNCVFLNGIGAGGGNVANAVLENCLVKGGKAYNGGNVICCIVRNCTVVDGTALHSGGAYYNCAVYNSICIGSSLMIGSWDWGPLVDSVNGQEENVYRDDPGFVDAANGDYRLAAGSPCIDAGDNSYVTTTTDLAGNARIANGMVDIGCYEYRTSSIPDEGRCRIKIYIDDKDFVKVKEGEIWIEHMAKELGIPGLYTSLPGRHNGNNYPVYVNGDEWMPDWSGAVDSPSTNCITKRVKLADFGVLMPLSQEYQYSLEVVTARTDINMVAAPSMGNDCISVAIDDDHYSAAAWYEFDIAWKKSNGTAVVPEPVTHTVTFDMNGAGGAVLEGRSVAEGEMVGELPDVTREGYSFDGWYTAASGGTKITASTTVTGDVTYYAHWIVNQYTMTFDANGGVGGTT